MLVHRSRPEGIVSFHSLRLSKRQLLSGPSALLDLLSDFTDDVFLRHKSFWEYVSVIQMHGKMIVEILLSLLLD